MTTKKHRRRIAGAAYLFTRNERGWAVTRMEKRTDRFYRSYQVVTDVAGNPRSCSCPDNFYRGRRCKHMAEVVHIEHEETTVAPLDNVPSWLPARYEEDFR